MDVDAGCPVRLGRFILRAPSTPRTLIHVIRATPPSTAVIGGGIAGLAAAHLLAQAGQRITLFERHAVPGFIASSVTLPGDRGIRVDVPLRVFYPGYYPTLARLYANLGVASEPVSYAASLCDAAGTPFFRYRNLRLGDRSWAYVLPGDLRGARARCILRGLLRFHREGLAAWRRGELAGRTLEDFLQARAYPPDMVEGFLLPALATVATCSYASARAFPAEVVIGYLGAGLTRECVRRAREGADDVAGRLLQGVADLRCGVKVLEVRCSGAGATVQVEGETLHRFDHVVVASQANQALSLLGDASDAERTVLGAFRYEPVEVLMHRDTAFMPARRRDWSAVNLRVHAGQQGPESTIWVNAVQPALRGAADVFQTVQPQREVDPSLVIARARFERPVVQADSTSALSGLGDLHAEPGRRVWFCGSYAQPGIPLLESAVRSAEVVVRALCAATSSTISTH